MNPDHIIGAIGAIGCVILLGLTVRDMTIAERPVEKPCKPIYVRGVDTYSPVELRRLANARERMERTK